MVIVVIHTSLKDEELPEKFEETVSKMLADLMDYPVEVNTSTWTFLLCITRTIINYIMSVDAFCNTYRFEY